MLFTSLVFASTASATCLHGLSMFAKRQENVKVNTFSYDDAATGQFNWASLAPENEACRTGINQTPINLNDSITAVTNKPTLNIPKQDVEFENLGTTIEVNLNGTTTFEGSDFQLVQFHMHAPSEHHINSEFFPLELHMVHQGVKDNTKLAVIALMFEVSSGESSSIIKSLSSSVKSIEKPGSMVHIAGGIDFTDVEAKIKSSPMQQYSGSLTTPPCAEGVTFLIVRDPLAISVADFNAIKKIVKFNARFIQNSLGSMNMLHVGGKSGNSTPAPATESKVGDATC